MIVDQRRQAMARRLGEADIARDHRVEYDPAEHGADIVRHLIGQAIAAIIHGEHHAEDRQAGIEATADALDRAEQLAEPFEREELALERHEQRVRGNHGVDRQQPERRRAIDQDHVPALRIVAGDRRIEAVGARIELDQLDLRARQILRRRHDVEPGDLGGRGDIDEIDIGDEQIIARMLALGPGDAEAGRGIALRIEIDQQDALAGRGERGADIDRRGGLTHPALLIGDSDADHLGRTFRATTIPDSGDVMLVRCGFEQIGKRGDGAGRDDRRLLLRLIAFDFAVDDDGAPGDAELLGRIAQELDPADARLDHHHRAIDQQRHDQPGHAGTGADIDPRALPGFGCQRDKLGGIDEMTRP
uniref:LigA n=1 Tax=Globodera pallida TaxID=36090 RepID=A0A183BUV4_GLOPA